MSSSAPFPRGVFFSPFHVTDKWTKRSQLVSPHCPAATPPTPDLLLIPFFLPTCAEVCHSSGKHRQSENLIMQAWQLPLLSCSQHNACLWKLKIMDLLKVKPHLSIIYCQNSRMQRKLSKGGLQSRQCLLLLLLLCAWVVKSISSVLSLQYKHVSEHVKSH